MRFCTNIFLLCLFLGLASAVNAADISGIVTDAVSKRPLQGCIVEIDNDWRQDTTGADGRYRLADNLSVAPLQAKKPVVPVVLNSRGIVSLSIEKQSRVRVAVYSLQGRKIRSSENVLDEGVYRLSPGFPAAGLYICIVELNGKRHSFKHSAVVSTFPSCVSVAQPHALDQSSILAKTLNRNSFDNGDSIQFTAAGYHPLRQSAAQLLKNGDVSLQPVSLPGGVRPGLWNLATSQGEPAALYVGVDGKTVDSLVLPAFTHCIQIADTITVTVRGPFAIPANGVVSVDTSMRLCFTGAEVYGTFTTDTSYSVSSSTQCQWTELYNWGTKIVNHYVHYFSLGGTLKLTSRLITLAINQPLHGRVENRTQKKLYWPGETVSLVVTNDSGYAVTGWDGAKVERQDYYTWTTHMDESVTLTPRVVKKFALSVTTDCGSVGNISRKFKYDNYALSDNLYEPGDTVTLTYQKRPEYEFIGWSGDVDTTSGEAMVVMTGDKSAHALCASRYFWKYDYQNRSGTVISLTGDTMCYASAIDTLVLLALPNKDYDVVGWSGSTWKTAGDTAWVILDTSKYVTPLFKSQRLLYAFNEPDNTDPFSATCISSDGNLLVRKLRTTLECYSFADDSVVWKTKPWNIYTARNTDEMIAFTPDNNFVVYADTAEGAKYYRISIIDAHSGAIVRKSDSLPPVRSIQFSPDGARMLTSNPVKIWDLATGTLIQSLPLSAAGGVMYSPEGTALLLYDDKFLELVDVATGESIARTDRTVADDIRAVAFSGDSASIWLLSYNGLLEHYSAADLSLLSSERLPNPFTSISAAAFSPGADRFAAVSSAYPDEWGATMFTTATMIPYTTLYGHKEEAWNLLYSRDGKRLFSRSRLNLNYPDLLSMFILWNVE